MTEISQERFEAWLFAQPDDRVWNYSDIRACVSCSFIKETTNYKCVSAGADNNWIGHSFTDAKTVYYPKWLYDLLWNVRMSGKTLTLILASSLKREFIKLFPDSTAGFLSVERGTENPSQQSVVLQTEEKQTK